MQDFPLLLVQKPTSYNCVAAGEMDSLVLTLSLGQKMSLGEGSACNQGNETNILRGHIG